MKENIESVDKFLLRIDRDLKQKAAIAAKDSNRSLNAHIITLIKDDLLKKKIK